MDNWKEWRKQQRAELMALRETITENDHRCWSSAITESLKQGFPVLHSRAVGFCWPHRGEYDPLPLMDFIHERGAILALPEVVNRHEPLRFRKWWREAPMKNGAYNIPVPDNTDSVAVGAVVIPMIGFDKRGFRLGYGSGYFDRTLVAIKPRPLTIGVAFEILRLDNLHPQPHDIPMDFIVTEVGIHCVTAAGLELISAEACTELLKNQGSAPQRGMRECTTPR
ncbi:5-formyltetrahydrofolate cyclo-ligase [Nitrosovibrio tenuis]|uniref:5-formyltetrahydrofolate cyclo-ligase n=1 Tax=Nitrosovibrio tenuis TaxID=1233 RepID=A0A1H7P329_9PROT|nr:5-formyltetrahydrofolate cyclo-ligase [Nitrosovibrio tenuis]SEL30203.1 5-formyltetrahydrofolate cyclo-ligase [Nitrosovibrio tenuis]